MHLTKLVSVVVVMAALAIGCKDKKDGAAASGSGAPAAGGTAPAVKEAPPAKLAAVDLSVGGDDFKKLTVQAPEGATAKESFGSVEITQGDGFGLQISKDAGNLADLKKEITANDVNKLKRFVSETATEQVYETEVMGKTQFHFNANVKVGDKEYRCENTKGGADKTLPQINAMLASCKSLAAAP
jgi:hypothetical protein